MLDKTLNGGGYTPTRGEGAFARQLLIASALRSLPARRTKSASPTSLPQSSSPVPPPEQKHSPGGALPLTAGDGDSPSRKSDVKIEIRTDVDKKGEVKPSD